jgi:alpha-N-arabinofuranosidase
VSLCNLHHDAGIELVCEVRGVAVGQVSGRILTGPAINSRNTFENADAVRPEAFDGARVSKTGVSVALPARSVVVLEVT